MSGPLTRIIEAFGQGVTTVDDLARQTGMPLEIARASVEHLVRMGRIEARELALGCPSSGCGGCASALGDGTPGCGLPEPMLPHAKRAGSARGLVTLKLATPLLGAAS